jgi:hypothetical protein
MSASGKAFPPEAASSRPFAGGGGVAVSSRSRSSEAGAMPSAASTPWGEHAPARAGTAYRPVEERGLVRLAGHGHSAADVEPDEFVTESYETDDASYDEDEDEEQTCGRRLWACFCACSCSSAVWFGIVWSLLQFCITLPTLVPATVLVVLFGLIFRGPEIIYRACIAMSITKRVGLNVRILFFVFSPVAFLLLLAIGPVFAGIAMMLFIISKTYIVNSTDFSQFSRTQALHTLMLLVAGITAPCSDFSRQSDAFLMTISHGVSEALKWLGDRSPGRSRYWPEPFDIRVDWFLISLVLAFILGPIQACVFGFAGAVVLIPGVVSAAQRVYREPDHFGLGTHEVKAEPGRVVLAFVVMVLFPVVALLGVIALPFVGLILGFKSALVAFWTSQHGWRGGTILWNDFSGYRFQLPPKRRDSLTEWQEQQRAAEQAAYAASRGASAADADDEEKASAEDKYAPSGRKSLFGKIATRSRMPTGPGLPRKPRDKALPPHAAPRGPIVPAPALVDGSDGVIEEAPSKALTPVEKPALPRGCSAAFRDLLDDDHFLFKVITFTLLDVPFWDQVNTRAWCPKGGQGRCSWALASAFLMAFFWGVVGLVVFPVFGVLWALVTAVPIAHRVVTGMVNPVFYPKTKPLEKRTITTGCRYFLLKWPLYILVLLVTPAVLAVSFVFYVAYCAMIGIKAGPLHAFHNIGTTTFGKTGKALGRAMRDHDHSIFRFIHGRVGTTEIPFTLIGYSMSLLCEELEAPTDVQQSYMDRSTLEQLHGTTTRPRLLGGMGLQGGGLRLFDSSRLRSSVLLRSFYLPRGASKTPPPPAIDDGTTPSSPPSDALAPDSLPKPPVPSESDTGEPKVTPAPPPVAPRSCCPCCDPDSWQQALDVRPLPLTPQTLDTPRQKRVQLAASDRSVASVPATPKDTAPEHPPATEPQSQASTPSVQEGPATAVVVIGDDAASERSEQDDEQEPGPAEVTVQATASDAAVDEDDIQVEESSIDVESEDSSVGVEEDDSDSPSEEDDSDDAVEAIVEDDDDDDDDEEESEAVKRASQLLARLRGEAP